MLNNDINNSQANVDDRGIIHIPSTEWNHMIDLIENPLQSWYNNLYLDVSQINLNPPPTFDKSIFVDNTLQSGYYNSVDPTDLNKYSNQPIIKNGKYKFYYQETQIQDPNNPTGIPIPVLGWLPAYLEDETTTDYAININIPNATSQVTSGNVFYNVNQNTGEAAISLELSPEDVQNGVVGFNNNIVIPLNNRYDVNNLVRFNELTQDPNDPDVMIENVTFNVNEITNDTTDQVNPNPDTPVNPLMRSVKNSKGETIIKRALGDTPALALPIYQGTMSNRIAVLQNHTINVDPSTTTTFSIQEYNNSMDNTSGKQFVGVRNITIVPNQSSTLEDKVINYNGYWVPTTITPTTGYSGIQSVTFNNEAVITTSENILTTNEMTSSNNTLVDGINTLVYNDFEITNSLNWNDLYKIFDNRHDVNGYRGYIDHQNVSSVYLTVKCPYPLILNRINAREIHSQNSNVNLTFNVYGGFDGINWTNIFTQTDAISTAHSNFDYLFYNNYVKYIYYKIEFSFSNTIDIFFMRELFMYTDIHANFPEENPVLDFGFSKTITENGQYQLEIPQNFNGIGSGIININVPHSIIPTRTLPIYEFTTNIGTMTTITTPGTYSVDGYTKTHILIYRDNNDNDFIETVFRYQISNPPYTQLNYKCIKYATYHDNIGHYIYIGGNEIFFEYDSAQNATAQGNGGKINLTNLFISIDWTQTEPPTESGTSGEGNDQGTSGDSGNTGGNTGGSSGGVSGRG